MTDLSEATDAEINQELERRICASNGHPPYHHIYVDDRISHCWCECRLVRWMKDTGE